MDSLTVYIASFVDSIIFLDCHAIVCQWAIAVKISYPPVDDTVLGNGNTIGYPHSLSYKVLEIQTKIAKLYGKSVKIS